MFELLAELVNEFSPIYFYLGLLLSVIKFAHIQIEYQNRNSKNNVFIRKSHAQQFQLLEPPEIDALMDIRHWIANKTKRIEIPDDDMEDSSFSNFYHYKNRGGQKWKKLLYSPSLKNIASFLGFYQLYYLPDVKAQPNQ